jgi:hypothetical protein
VSCASNLHLPGIITDRSPAAGFGESAKSGGDAAAANSRVRVALLATLRHLVSYGTSFVKAIDDAGLFDCSRAALLSPRWAEQSFEPPAGQLAEAVEHWRLWRACSLAGMFFLLAEEAFPAMLHVSRLAARAAQPADSRQADGSMRLRGEGAVQQASLALAAMHALCALLATLASAAFPSAEGQASWTRCLAAAEGAAAAPPLSLGFAQQILPLITPFIAASAALPPAPPPHWPVIEAWASKCRGKTPAGNDQAAPGPPRAPKPLHPALLVPQCALAAAARAAALSLAAEVVTLRRALGSSIAPDRSAALADLLALVPATGTSHGDGKEPAQPPLCTAQALLTSAGTCIARARLQCAAASALARTRDATDTPLAAVPVPLHATSTELLQAVKGAAGALLRAAALLHSAAGKPRRLRVSAAWAAARMQCAQLHGEAYLQLLQTWVQADAYAASADTAGPPSEIEHVLLTRALLAVPTVAGPASCVLAMQALQLLFHPCIAGPTFRAGARACCALPAAHPGLAEAALGGDSAATVLSAVEHDGGASAGSLLVHGYGAAWAGAEVAAAAAAAAIVEHDGGGDQSNGVRELSADAPMQPWQPTGGPEGQRLPAPPDWFLLALATPEAPAAKGQGPDGRHSAGEGLAAVLASAAVWLCGLCELDVLAAERDAAGSTQHGNHGDDSSGLHPDDPVLSQDEVRLARALLMYSLSCVVLARRP